MATIHFIKCQHHLSSAPVCQRLIWHLFMMSLDDSDQRVGQGPVGVAIGWSGISRCLFVLAASDQDAHIGGELIVNGRLGASRDLLLRLHSRGGA